MAFQVSPGVEVKEIDLTNVIPAVSTSIGGFAGYFNWGPVGEIQLIGSEKEMADVFGKPDKGDGLYTGSTTSNVGVKADICKDFYTAASFLKYGNALKIVRANDPTTGVELSSPLDTPPTDPADGKFFANAQSGEIGVTQTPLSGVPINIKNKEDYEGLSQAVLDDKGAFIARYPGALGNSIRVEIINAAIFNDTPKFTDTSLTGQTDQQIPVVAKHAGDISSTAELASDELHILVIDHDGKISGTAGTILEQYEYVSTTAGAVTSDGSSNYVKDVLLQKSNWIYCGKASELVDIAEETLSGNTDSGTGDSQTFANKAADFDAIYTVTQIKEGTGTDEKVTTFNVSITKQLANGEDYGTTSTAGDISTALDEFADSETVDVNLLFAHVDTNGSEVIAEKLISIANARKDVVAFVSPPIEDSTGTSPLTDVKTFFNGLPSSSYAVSDSSSVKVYDKYNDGYINIPASGYTAGLCANTDNVAEPWFSPAGFNRGQLLQITKVNYNPKKADRDELYKARINPIVAFPGQGTVLFGDKTLQSKPSAFDRINVRRLFIVLEKAIATAAKFQLFELNDEFTRAMFRNMVEPFLRDVKGRRGITDFLVVCDETNNTGEVIDTNRFVADIFIKPARSINFITLNFIATRTGVEFSEIVGK